jgi:hypothetical protein
MKLHPRVLRRGIVLCLASLCFLTTQAFAQSTCAAPGARLFESKDSRPLGAWRMRSYGLERQNDKTFCLSVRMDLPYNRQFLIWINDNPRTAYPLKTGEVIAQFPLDGDLVRTGFGGAFEAKTFAKLDKSMLEPAITQGVVLEQLPEQIDPNPRYLFYLHGYIVEDRNSEPVHPEYGMYQYSKIRLTFKDSGFVVISEARKKDREIEPYARKVAEQIRQLLKAGVPADHITVVGASQGSWIAMLASTYVANRGVNFVLIAACAADKEFLKTVNLHGNVLSIYERSDLAQSCRDYRADATGIKDWKEVELNTGLKHGFLYRPLPEWVDPAVAWAKGKR